MVKIKHMLSIALGLQSTNFPIYGCFWPGFLEFLEFPRNLAYNLSIQALFSLENL